MGIMALANELFPLRDTELVLLIDDDQSELFHLKACGNQRVRADEQAGICAGRRLQRQSGLDLRILILDLRRFPRASLQMDRYAQRLEPAGEGAKMLLGEHLGRRH